MGSPSTTVKAPSTPLTTNLIAAALWRWAVATSPGSTHCTEMWMVLVMRSPRLGFLSWMVRRGVSLMGTTSVAFMSPA